MAASKRIPVSKERWEQLGDLKKAGQTWDELLGEMVEEYRKQRLAEMIEQTDEAEFVDVTDDW